MLLVMIEGVAIVILLVTLWTLVLRKRRHLGSDHPATKVDRDPNAP